MRREEAKDVYDLFDRFAEEFLMQGNSILTNHKNILTPESLKDCHERYIVNYDESNERFDDKIKAQFEGAHVNARLVFAHAEWLWSYSVDDISIGRKRFYAQRITEIPEEEFHSDVFTKGFGSAGQWHTNNKYREIEFTFLISKFIHEQIANGTISTTAEIKDHIERICLAHKYSDSFEEHGIDETLWNVLPSERLAMTNVLLHVVKPDKYERIASDNHKRKIIDSFSSLIEDEDLGSLNSDEIIALVRNRLNTYLKSDFDFYDADLAKIWRYSDNEEHFSEIQALRYKKAIVLYGPPGTGKTYTAAHLAETLITSSFLKDKSNVRNYFKDPTGVTENRIHHLQLHGSYTYEDFIAGYQLVGKETIAAKGKLFKICEAAQSEIEDNPDSPMPHVLILDEMNRVDLSRLFGEVMSAMEYRDKAIEVSIGDFQLTIPRNLFIIGTMNEIDFSLEQLDFAMRRRFLWFSYGFSTEALTHIIELKNEKLKKPIRNSEEIEQFIANSEAVNTALAEIEELGPNYQVGHTFFAEIIDIYESQAVLENYKREKKSPLFRVQGPADILWDISIAPMIDSYLGNIDPAQKNEKMSQLQLIYKGDRV